MICFGSLLARKQRLYGIWSQKNVRKDDLSDSIEKDQKVYGKWAEWNK